jgi:hypothetical protein
MYNLESDIGEQDDLAAAQPEVTHRLRNRLHRWRDEVAAQMPTAR